MTNTEKIKQVFISGAVKEATNAELMRLTGVQPHAQVFQITDKLVKKGFLKYALKGKEKVFYMSQQRGMTNVKDSEDVGTLSGPANVGNRKAVLNIEQVGFRYSGKWTLIDESKLSYEAEPDILSRSPVLYAFVSMNEVLYIGKTTMPLGKRLYGYANPGPKQSTNQKVNLNIQGLMSNGVSVEIWVFAPMKNEIVYRGIPVNLPAGLEDSLIDILKPKWNHLGK